MTITLGTVSAMTTGYDLGIFIDSPMKPGAERYMVLY